MVSSSSDNDDVRKLPDRVILRLYKIESESKYIEVILDRYKYFILKVISNWHFRNTHHVKLYQSDFQDVHQYAKLAVMTFMARVKNISHVKNVSVSIKSYIYTMLNKYYRHCKYEYPDEEIFKKADREVEPEINDLMDFEIVNYDIILFLKYQYRYNYYKLGMLFTKLNKSQSMQNSVANSVKRKIKYLKWELKRRNMNQMLKSE